MEKWMEQKMENPTHLMENHFFEVFFSPAQNAQKKRFRLFVRELILIKLFF